MAVAAVSTAGFLLACASAPEERDWTKTAEPGIYNTRLWRSGDVDGQVGYPLDIGYPTLLCLPARKWSGRVSIVSGQFPPGISLHDSDLSIKGIPTERGHWIVKLKLYDINCNGEIWQLKEYIATTEIRFHITGSGRVVK
jgi:hypothetical protein